MQAHNIKSNSKNKTKKRVGRGGKRGTYSGRGTKGQKARSGRRIRPQVRDTLKKIPKKKGYRVKNVPVQIVAVNIRDIERRFDSGAEITPKALVASGLVHKAWAKIPEVKILGSGEIKKNFVFKGCIFSKKVEEALQKSGSRIIPKKE